mgnify:CR=1 FL=1|jgi:type-F conjugative transfer system pilin assembly thiol-disulfide isomerase TrbB
MRRGINKNRQQLIQCLMGIIILMVVSACSQANITAGQITALIDQQQTPAKTERTPMAALRKTYAVVLFYRSGCPHCQRFDPIVSALTHRDHLTTYAYTTDGRDLPSFPHSLMATPPVLSAFFGGRERVVPAVFLVNLHTLASYPVSVGEMSYAAFDRKLHQVASRLVGDQQNV